MIIAGTDKIVFADEGMWTFDNLPLKQFQDANIQSTTFRLFSRAPIFKDMEEFLLGYQHATYTFVSLVMDHKQSTHFFFSVVFSIIFPLLLFSQQEPRFTISLRFDFESAQKLIELREGTFSNINRAAQLRGNRIAAATSFLLARTPPSEEIFISDLEFFRGNLRSSDNLFGLNETGSLLPAIKELLTEARRRQLDRRVIASINQFFPADARFSAAIPVYFVAFGNDKAAAFVRRILWQDNSPIFTGSSDGEISIVVNLTRFAEQPGNVQSRLVYMLSTLAHEAFHAVFSAYQDSSPLWQNSRRSSDPLIMLAELVQNEGVAYLLSMQHYLGGTFPQGLLEEGKAGVRELNRSFSEMLSPNITHERINELLLNANLSGSLEKNYGVSAGLLMAYTIDTKAGRKILAETLKSGAVDFFRQYNLVAQRYADAPPVIPLVMEHLGR